MLRIDPDTPKGPHTPQNNCWEYSLSGSSDESKKSIQKIDLPKFYFFTIALTAL
jgi:hypothetical protein